MKIAFVLQPWDLVSTPFQGGSSIAIIAYELARRLARHHNVVLYARRGRGQKRDELLSDGLRIRRIGVFAWPFMALDRVLALLPPSKPLFASYVYYLPYVLKVAWRLRREQFDIVHFFSFSQWTPLFRAIAPRTRTILRMEGESLTQLDYARVEKQLRKVDVITGCSDYITDGVRHRFPHLKKRCHTVHDGADAERFQPRSGTAPAGRMPSRVLFVGRLSPEKGIHVLIDAFRQILKERPDCRLELVGRGGLLPYTYYVQPSADPATRALARFYGTTLREKIRRQILESDSCYIEDLRGQLSAAEAEAVDFRGPLPHPELANCYQQADVFVFPSVGTEAFGVPVAEAMACGLPVIGARSGGIPEQIDHGVTGLVVDRDDPKALAAALRRLLDDRTLCEIMGEAGRRRLVEHLSWDCSARKLDEHCRAVSTAI